MKLCNLFVIIIVLLISLTFISCASNNDQNSSPTEQLTHTSNSSVNKEEKEMSMKNGLVYIEGEKADNLFAVFDSTNVKLPFIETAKELGMAVEIISEEIVHITYNSEVFVLRLSPDIILAKQGNEEENLMIPPPGTVSYYCKYESDDVVIDSETLSGVLYLMGFPVQIFIDNTNNQVNIITVIENS